ncbi:MAG TPA: SLC13 family permease [Alphaproteobacteria bacterium]|jgi:di/tricarboxylate transporter|nr:SLC13 family permease [Alphaproteobacteria bacterium]MDP7429449.1 SLC13 family permease [Alphaproteobacteria bacterium]HJM51015.1 SLC13 family permease [Alphaproteobacteria bacterium]
MSLDQVLITAILVAVFALFARGPWRYDVVAFAALLLAVLLGVVPTGSAFAGFGHPAVITVAAVLVISRALSNSGALDMVLRLLAPATATPTLHVGALSGVAAAASALMNNVGALALMMPLALQSAAKAERSPSILLMPLSFGSILGGLVTMIGTPPNIIIATYRGERLGQPFSMFDFTPVGGVLALAGLVFIALVGWRLIPGQRRARLTAAELFDIEDYVAEIKVPKDSQAVGLKVKDLEDSPEDFGVAVIAIVRRGQRIVRWLRREAIKSGDILIVEADPAGFDKFVSTLGLTFVGTDQARGHLLHSEDMALIEAVVPPRTRLEGRTPAQLRFRSRYGINLLAVARQGKPFRDRLRGLKFQAGDVLLLQGEEDTLAEVVAALGLLPLAERGWQVGKRHQAGIAMGVFGLAIVAATLGVVSLPVALCAAASLMVMTNLVPARELYDAIDWPVIVLLGSMIPLAGALESSGTTELAARGILAVAGGLAPVLVLALLLVVTMTLSDILNNAATALVMAPIAVSLAASLGVSSDAFLMAVAVGASCAFLTPIGHQNNILVMGPGGYEFGDYWRLGLPLEVLLTIIAVPMIVWVWPL